MGLFKRNKDAPLIPPVAQAGPPPGGAAAAASDPYASGAAAGGRAGGGAGAGPGGGNRYGGGDPYASTAVGRAGGLDASNPYAKATTAQDAARNELFSGMGNIPQREGPQRQYGYEGREAEEDFDEDEEIEGIKQEMRGLKHESLASTRSVRRTGPGPAGADE